MILTIDEHKRKREPSFDAVFGTVPVLSACRCRYLATEHRRLFEVEGRRLQTLILSTVARMISYHAIRVRVALEARSMLYPLGFGTALDPMP